MARRLATFGSPREVLRHRARARAALLGDPASAKGALEQARHDQDDAERYCDPLADEIGGEFAFGRARACRQSFPQVTGASIDLATACLVQGERDGLLSWLTAIASRRKAEDDGGIPAAFTGTLIADGYAGYQQRWPVRSSPQEIAAPS